MSSITITLEIYILYYLLKNTRRTPPPPENCKAVGMCGRTDPFEGGLEVRTYVRTYVRT